MPQAFAALVAVALSAASTMVLPREALAVLNSPNAQIARSPEAALRRATPAFNADVFSVQKKLEDVQTLLRIPQRKPWGGMAKDVLEAQVCCAFHAIHLAKGFDVLLECCELAILHASRNHHASNG